MQHFVFNEDLGIDHINSSQLPCYLKGNDAFECNQYIIKPNQKYYYAFFKKDAYIFEYKRQVDILIPNTWANSIMSIYDFNEHFIDAVESRNNKIKTILYG